STILGLGKCHSNSRSSFPSPSKLSSFFYQNAARIFADHWRACLAVERRGRSEGEAKTDFVRGQKWRERPEFIEKEHGDKDALKIYPQILVVKGNGGDKVAAQSDAYSRSHEYGRQGRPCGGRGQKPRESGIGSAPME